jgi:hypothetical protein
VFGDAGRRSRVGPRTPPAGDARRSSSRLGPLSPCHRSDRWSGWHRRRGAASRRGSVRPRPPTPPSWHGRGRPGCRADAWRRLWRRPGATSWSSTPRDRRRVRDHRRPPGPVDAVRPAGHRGGQIGEHLTRRVDPGPAIGIRQNHRDLRRQSGQIRQFPQHRGPGMRHDTRPVRRDFHPRTCCDILHLRSAFPPECWNPRQVPSFLAGQALSLFQGRATPTFTKNRG